MTRGVKADIENMITNIEPFLLEGCSLHEACSLGLVPYTTVIDYVNNDNEIRKKIDRIKNQYFLALRKSMNSEAKEKGELALKVLERLKKDEFSTKVDNETNVNLTLMGTVKVGEKEIDFDVGD